MKFISFLYLDMISLLMTHLFLKYVISSSLYVTVMKEIYIPCIIIWPKYSTIEYFQSVPYFSFVSKRKLIFAERLLKLNIRIILRLNLNIFFVIDMFVNN